jgi:hypothetical protein
VSSDSIVKGIIDDIINTAVKTAEVTCTLLKLCLTPVLFNKRRMQVKCISLFNLTRLCHGCKYFVFLIVDFGSFHSRVDNVINDSFNYTVTRHR